MPGLLIREARDQAPVLQAPYHAWTSPDEAIKATFHGGLSDAYLVRFPGCADFEVSIERDDVVCWPHPQAAPELIEHLYENQVVPLLRSRGPLLVLHGSVVSFGGSCCGFVGASGAGKSTLAASLAAAGHPFLSDDQLCIREQASGHVVLPARALVRLREDSHAQLLKTESGPGAKALVQASAALPHCDTPQPLACIFLLEPHAAQVRVEAVDPSAALIELMRHAFMLEMRDRELLSAHFDRMARLVDAVPVFRLAYPRDFAALGILRATLREHVASMAQGCH